MGKLTEVIAGTDNSSAQTGAGRLAHVGASLGKSTKGGSAVNVTREMEQRLRAEAERTAQQASANIERWGNQDGRCLVACMAEELGEVAEAILRISVDWEKTKVAYRDAGREARDLGALCLQMALLCEVED